MVCVLIITTLKEKLPRRRREVHWRRVSIMNSFLFEKQKWFALLAHCTIRYYLHVLSFRGAFFVVAEVGRHVDEELECRI